MAGRTPKKGAARELIAESKGPDHSGRQRRYEHKSNHCKRDFANSAAQDSSFIIHPSSFPKVPPPTTPASPCIGVQNLSPTPVLRCLHRVTPILKETAEPSLSNPQIASTQPPAVARTPAASWGVRSSWPSASLSVSPNPPAPPRNPQPSTLSHQPSQWRPKSPPQRPPGDFFYSRTQPTHPVHLPGTSPRSNERVRQNTSNATQHTQYQVF